MNEILQKRIEEAAKKEAWKRYSDCPPVGLFGTGDYEPAECYESDREVFIDAVNWCVNYLINNQWISVEEALPTERDEEDEQYSTNVFARTKDCIKYAYYDFYNESWCSVEGGYRFGGDVTHWMPIPELKGGE